jgi:hypothetical protein
MILLTDINLILFLIVFITRTNISTNQQFINIVNNKRTVVFPTKHLGLNNYLTNSSFSTKFSRKRRQSNHDFQSDSLKYFTCALVNRFFAILLELTQISSDS